MREKVVRTTTMPEGHVGKSCAKATGQPTAINPELLEKCWAPSPKKSCNSYSTSFPGRTLLVEKVVARAYL